MREIPLNKNLLIKLVIAGILLRFIYFFLIPTGQNPDEFFFFERVWVQARDLKEPGFFVLHEKNFPNNEYFYPPLYFTFLSGFLTFSNEDLDVEISFLEINYIFRLGAVLISVFQLFIVFKIIRALKIPRVPSSLVMIIFALLPSYASFSSYMNPNLWLVTLFLVFLYFLIKAESGLKSIILGLVTGLALLTKFEGVLLLLAYPFYLYLDKHELKKILRSSAIFLLTSFLIGGWWYVRNLYQHGWVYDKDLFLASISLNSMPFSFDGYINRLLMWVFETFFIAYGQTNNIRLGELGYITLFIFLAACIYGLFKDGLAPIKKYGMLKTIYFVLGALFVLNVAILMLLNFTVSFQPQGRYLYPSILFISLNLAFGLAAFFKANSNIKKYLPLSLFIFLLCLNLWGISCVSKFYYGVSLGFEKLGCVYYR